MRKIPSLYRRNPDDMSSVMREVHPDCGWVMDGEGRPTVKWDGTCVRLDKDYSWWARHQVRPGKVRPPNYQVAEHDEVTGRTQGWIPMQQSQYQPFFLEAVVQGEWEPGTFELIGPRIGSNPHQVSVCVLIAHGTTPLADVPTQYDALGSWLREYNADKGYLEGVVWHHADGRMAKIKTHDFPH